MKKAPAMRNKSLKSLFASLLLAFAATTAHAQAFDAMAVISSTMGVNAGRICMGEGTRGDLGCPTYAPFVSSSGFIGIGLDTPGVALQISSSQPHIFLQHSGFVSSSNNVSGIISFRDSANAQYGWMGDGSSSNNFITLSDLRPTGAVILSAGGLGRVHVSNTGYVGIGNSGPSSTLHVNGAINIGQDASATTNTCDTNRAGAIRWNGTEFQTCFGSGGWATLTSASVSGTLGKQVVFNVNRGGTNQTVSVNTYTKINWTNEESDTNNNFASDRFTPTVPGYYLVSAQTYCSTNGLTYCHTTLYKNGANYKTGFQSSENDNMPNVTAVVYMNGTTDYLEVYVYVAGGTNIMGSANYTFFSGALINARGADGGSGGATALSGLTDVSLAGPANKEALVYNGSAWSNGYPAAISNGSSMVSVNSNNFISFTTNGTVANYINSSGHIIGSKAVLGGAGTAATRLGVIGNGTDLEVARFSTDGGGSGSVQGKTYIGLHHWPDANVTGYLYPSARIGVEEFGTSSFDSNLVFQTRNSAADVVPTTQMVLAPDGKLGIGVTTPTTKLHVAGTGVALSLQDTGYVSSSNNVMGFVSLQDSNGKEYGWLGDGDVSSNYVSVVDARPTGMVVLRGGTGSAGVVYVSSSVGVGIGTNSPRNGLEVASGIIMGNGHNLSWGGTFAGNWPTIASSGAGFIAFYPRGAGSAETMRITSATYVGIGNSLPAAKLHVNGAILANGSTNGASGSASDTWTRAYLAQAGYIWSTVSGGDTSYNYYGQRDTVSGGFASFYYNSTYVGGISTNGSSVNYNTTSDYRLKENVTSIEGALAKVGALKPAHFSFKTDPSHTLVDGFIAHEVAAVAPYAVKGEKDAVDKDGKPEYQQVDYGKLTPLLTAAVQELKTENDSLKAELATQKARSDAIEARLKALESK